MGTCYLFGAAPISDYSWMQVDLQEEDLVICADGGYVHAQKLGLIPDWLVGDFDSGEVPADVSNLIRVKPEKDDTDMHLAVTEGMKHGYRDFVIYGALGGRFDHSMANVQMMAEFLLQGVRIKLLDQDNEMIMVKDGTILIDKELAFPYLSLFSFDPVCVVTIEGVKYPLHLYRLTNTFPLGISNEIVDSQAKITAKEGILLIIRSRDHK